MCCPTTTHLVREAMVRELDRGGQIYYVHNRVQSIYYVAEKLRQLIPEAEIGVGHGQLEEHQLEKVMLDFFSGKDDVLVCTTIIESGLDVPNANTLIIEDADLLTAWRSSTSCAAGSAAAPSAPTPTCSTSPTTA